MEHHEDFEQKDEENKPQPVTNMKQYLKPQDMQKLYLSWFEATLKYRFISLGRGTFPGILKPI